MKLQWNELIEVGRWILIPICLHASPLIPTFWGEENNNQVTSSRHFTSSEVRKPWYMYSEGLSELCTPWCCVNFSSLFGSSGVNWDNSGGKNRVAGRHPLQHQRATNNLGAPETKILPQYSSITWETFHVKKHSRINGTILCSREPTRCAKSLSNY